VQLPDQGAEESFSVYDHPRVQIFRKTAAFNAGRIRQQLSQGINWSSVIRFTPLQATAAPNGLLLTPSERSLYDETARWSSARISAQSQGSRLPVLAWFFALQMVGLLALPIAFAGFRHLLDGGYAFSKAVGLLLTAWAVWLLASLRVAPFTWWTIVAVLAGITLASAAVLARHGWEDLWSFVRARWRLLALEELLFWVFFGVLLFVRWSSPDLWHPGTGGEKPMDVAYLTAVVRTPYFPAYDPWFATGYINYYYFGFVLVATLVHLTSIVPTIAYNLALPTFFAMTAMGAFAVAINLAEKWPGNHRSAEWSWKGIGRTLLLVGVCGALFVAVIGNLAQVQLVWNGVRNLSSLAAEGQASPFALAAQFADGLGKWMSGQKLPINTDWWYWNATRVIPAAEGEAGPINELPFFTFIFADLHAHMMALPYTLLVLGLAVGIIRGAGATPSRRPGERNPHEAGEFVTLLLMALATGALWPINTWDFPTYTGLATVALVLREYTRRGRFDVSAVWAGTWRAALVVVLGRLLFQPFHQAYASAYFGAELWKGSNTPFKAYLIIHGFFLFVLGSYLLLEFLRGAGHNALVRRFRLGLRYWRRRSRLGALLHSLARPTPAYRIAVSLVQLGLAAVIVMLLVNRVAGFALGMSVLSALLLASRRPQPRRQFLLSMVALGFLLTAVVEIVVLKGDISRMNTVFKFYLQVWVLWAVASAAVLPAVASRLGLRPQPKRATPFVELPEGSAWTPELAAQLQRGRARSPGGWARRWWTVFGLLLAACFLYPFTAAPVRMRDRFEGSLQRTLDGTAYMRTSVYYDEGRPVTLEWDRQAFEWLHQNVRGIPAILEASTPLYRWGSRVSIYTGLPTIIGWDWHQKQQRSILPGPIIDRRIEDVRRIYTSTDVNESIQLLSQYGVKYIYVGQLEQLYYAGEGLAKFEQPGNPWSVVYQNEQVKIYEVH
jgi:YYY domain-containing protein